MSSATRLSEHATNKPVAPKGGVFAQGKRRSGEKEKDGALFAGALLVATTLISHRPQAPLEQPGDKSLSSPKSGRETPSTTSRQSGAQQGGHSLNARKVQGESLNSESASVGKTPATRVAIKRNLSNTTQLVAKVSSPGHPTSRLTTASTGRRITLPVRVSQTAPHAESATQGLNLLLPEKPVVKTTAQSKHPVTSLVQTFENQHSQSKRHVALGSATNSYSAQTVTTPLQATPGTTAPTLNLQSSTIHEQFTQLVSQQVAHKNHGGLVVQVQPSGMGPITVTVNDIAGQVHVHIAVEQIQTLQWFHAQHQSLVENLVQNGYETAQMTFSMANSFSDSGHQEAMPETDLSTSERKSVAGVATTRTVLAPSSTGPQEGRWYV